MTSLLPKIYTGYRPRKSDALSLNNTLILQNRRQFVYERECFDTAHTGAIEVMTVDLYNIKSPWDTTLQTLTVARMVNKFLTFYKT
jgi:hypothetical protein